MKLKDILLETRLNAKTIPEILGDIQKYENSDLIFFDLETLGLDPNKPYVQITQMGIIVLDGKEMEIKKSYNWKIELEQGSKNFIYNKNSKERKEWELDKKEKGNMPPDKILDMTGYFNELPEKLKTESEAILDFKNLILNSKNPILIAHNASFDMKFINVRAKILGIQMFKYPPVFDTMRFAKYFLIPILKKINDTEVLEKLRKYKKITHSDGTKKYVPTNNYSASMGKLAPALFGKLNNWHDALADVRTMIELFKKIIDILKENEDVDISQLQAKEYKQYKRIKGHN